MNASGSALALGALELDHHDRQAVEEEHDVGLARGLADDLELVDRQPVVLAVLPVHQPRDRPDGLAVHPGLDRDAAHQQVVQAPVLGDRVSGEDGVAHLVGCVAHGAGGQAGVEPGNRGGQAAGEDRIVVGAALGARRFGRDRGGRGVGEAERLKLAERPNLQFLFG